MRKSIVAVMLVALVALAGTTGSARAASQGPTNVIVSPGSRVCLPVVYGTYKVHGQGSSNYGVRFSLHQSPDNVVEYISLAQSADNATYWAVDTNSTSSPGLFPGYFKFCARNLGSVGASVTLTLQTDADAP